MTVGKEILLECLPPYEDKWLLINPSQNVHDIIHEVLAAHDEFANYYDNIAVFFDADNTDKICNQLYAFCKKNLKYNEETEDFQSTSVPQGLLARGECDCKGYANFIGGILDALNRLGKKIDWCYVFASYELFNKDPHHVFISVYNNGNEIWADPTPGADSLTPIWRNNKKIAAVNVPRTKAIGAIHSIGKASLTVTPVIEEKFNYTGNPNYSGVTLPYLGLSEYRDLGGDRKINEGWIADQLNSILRKNGLTHTWSPDFVKWVYDSNIRSWNFLYPGGVRPGFTAQNILPANYPRWIITPDGRLTLDKDVKLDDYRNAEIHLLTAWGQDLINQHDPSPYPLKPQAVKEFSQGKEGNLETRNLFTEARGQSIFTDIGKALEHTVNFVKDGLIKIIGIVPRNAFLALVGLNVFHMANDLQEHINNGDWERIADKWRTLGGNPDKLHNTIEKGSKVPAIENTTQEVDEAAAIGAVQIAAILAAAAPIIAALLKFLNKDGKLNGTIQAVQSGLQTAFPDQDFSFLNGTLTQNGMPVDFTADPIYNENSPYYNPNGSSNNLITWVKQHPLPTAGIALILWELFAPKKMRLLNK